MKTKQNNNPWQDVIVPEINSNIFLQFQVVPKNFLFTLFKNLNDSPSFNRWFGDYNFKINEALYFKVPFGRYHILWKKMKILQLPYIRFSVQNKSIQQSSYKQIVSWFARLSLSYSYLYIIIQTFITYTDFCLEVTS